MNNISIRFRWERFSFTACVPHFSRHYIWKHDSVVPRYPYLRRLVYGWREFSSFWMRHDIPVGIENFVGDDTVFDIVCRVVFSFLFSYWKGGWILLDVEICSKINWIQMKYCRRHFCEFITVEFWKWRLPNIKIDSPCKFYFQFIATKLLYWQ